MATGAGRAWRTRCTCRWTASTSAWGSSAGVSARRLLLAVPGGLGSSLPHLLSLTGPRGLHWGRGDQGGGQVVEQIHFPSESDPPVHTPSSLVEKVVGIFQEPEHWGPSRQCRFVTHSRRLLQDCSPLLRAVPSLTRKGSICARCRVLWLSRTARARSPVCSISAVAV